MGDLRNQQWPDPADALHLKALRVVKLDDVPAAPHLQVFTYEQVNVDDGYGSSSCVSMPVMWLFTLQSDAEEWIGLYKQANHGKPIWVQRSHGRLTIETKTTIKIA